jgi:hypothetical protein
MAKKQVITPRQHAATLRAIASMVQGGSITLNSKVSFAEAVAEAAGLVTIEHGDHGTVVTLIATGEAFPSI